MQDGRHRWTREDDIVALYVSLHGSRRLPVGEAKIASLRGLKEGSLTMRVSNFNRLDGRPELANAAELSRTVYREYKTKSEPELRKLVLGILGLLPDGTAPKETH